MDLSKHQSEWVALSSIDYADKTYQYRRQVGPENVKDLADSINKNGQDIPIVCRRMADGRLQIICGFRRYTAVRLLGWEKLKVMIVPVEDMPDTEARLLSARENMARAQYSNMDKMFMCKKLSDQGVNNVEIGSIIGKTEGQVRRYIKVANAPTEVHEQIKAGEISATKVGNDEARNNYEPNVDNTKYNVKSARNNFSAKLNIELNEQSEATVDAFINDVKKAWKQALKKSKTHRKFGESKTRLSGGEQARRPAASGNLNQHIDNLHQVIDSMKIEPPKN